MITCKKNVGLVISLKEHNKLHLPHGKDDFFQTQNKLVVRESLHRFLADAREDSESQTVLFDHVVGRKEQASRSRPIGKSKIPITELDALEQGTRAFLLKEQAPETSEKGREIIKNFRFPDPESEPEMYRLYGPPWNRRLLVLWGCEQGIASSLPPMEAIKKLRLQQQPFWQMMLERVLWLILFLLLLLVAGLLIWLASHPDYKPRGQKHIPGPKPTSPTIEAINTLPNGGSNGMFHSQYLTVTLDPTNGLLPAAITAKVGHPGKVDFHKQYSTNLQSGQSHTYNGFTKAGNYRIEWEPDASDRVINGEFVKVSLRQYEAQKGQLIANLFLSPSSAHTGAVIRADSKASSPADAASKVTGVQIDWLGKGRFEDLNTNTEAHIFQVPGHYPVTLKVTDQNSRVATDTVVAHIYDGTEPTIDDPHAPADMKHGPVPPANQPPIAKLRLVSRDTNALVATLSDDGSVDPDGRITSWTISWGDNTADDHFSSSPTNVSHRFPAKGTYWASLNCVDDRSTPSHEPAHVEVQLGGKQDGGPPQSPPKPTSGLIDLSLSTQKQEARTVEFLAQVDAFAFPILLKVDYGDRSDPIKLPIGGVFHGEKRSEQKSLRHVYAKDGTYQATATATDPDGREQTRTVTVTVPPPPTPIPEIDQLEVTRGPSSRAPRDGKVEVVLLVRSVRNPNATLSVEEWSLDGVRQESLNTQLTSYLPEGTYKVTVKARVAGQETALETKVSVKVSMKVVSTIENKEGDFTIQPQK